MKEKRPVPLRGSGLGLGALWLSRGERAALEALGDAGPYILRGGFVWGWRAIAVQAALVAVMLLPWGYYAANPRMPYYYDFVQLHALYALFGLPIMHVAVMVAVDGMQATRVARTARQLNVHLTAMEPAAVALCAVLPQRRALTGAVLLGTLGDAAIVAMLVRSPGLGHDMESWIIMVALSIWRVAILLGLRGPVEHCFVRNWLSWGRGFWAAARASFLAHLFHLPPLLLALKALVPNGELAIVALSLCYPLLLRFMFRYRSSNDPIPGFDEWCMFREDAK